MSAVAPVERLPLDKKTEAQLKRGEKLDERPTLRRSKERLTSRGATIAAIVIAVLWTTPTLGLLITSFRPPELINTSGWWSIFVNPGFTVSNYEAVLSGTATTVTLGQSFINSIAITIPASIFPLVIAALAAYAFAWIPFRGRNILFIGVFALQVVPIQMALVPLLSLFARGLKIGGVEVFEGLGAGGNSYGQIWIAHTIFALPLAIFLLHNFISEIPHELIEAARVDGAGHGQTFFRIVLPLAMPAIASFAIFQFLWVWNDLLVALVFADGAVGPITKVLREITGNRGQDWYLLTAGAFVAMIVPLIVFFALQRFFVRGLLAGSTKG
ncbi:MAG: sugar ABC transporter permease [Micrococcales bacterium 70-64]|nr:carbohydrate ABC transporter permease [Leifsonia sp.]ODU63310.1 MAG: sugar ABC transporter permease [Leifsonia sp. SCN 70-46]OJX85001.1 MAG: sugar ABC transporter permease [Micrococcales bacterium 70-64]